MICENCNKEHNGSYGSGRFCSKKCARGFSTKEKRQEINEKVSKILKSKHKDRTLIFKKRKSIPRETRFCKYCYKSFEVKIYDKKRFCSTACYQKFAKETGKASNNAKKSYKTGRKVKGGTTSWYTYKNIRVQGTYELRTCYILDKMKELNFIKDWEYTNDRINYISEDKKERTYLLDFKIFNLDNTFYYLEVKGYQKNNDLYKWNATRKQYKLEIWFEKELKEKEKELNLNLELIRKDIKKIKKEFNYICDYCGKSFISFSKRKEGKKSFCSFICSGKSSKNSKKLVNCIRCNKEFLCSAQISNKICLCDNCKNDGYKFSYKLNKFFKLE